MPGYRRDDVSGLGDDRRFDNQPSGRDSYSRKVEAQPRRQRIQAAIDDRTVAILGISSQNSPDIAVHQPHKDRKDGDAKESFGKKNQSEMRDLN